jgi:hypothetical protein
MSVPQIIKAIGFTVPLVDVFPFPKVANRAPTITDTSYPTGQVWIFVNGDDRLGYLYGGLNSAREGVWILSSSSAGDLETLTADSGVATPVGGDINVVGGTNINTSATGDELEINLDSSVTVTDVTGGNLKVYANRLEAQNTNGSVVLYPNGTGEVQVKNRTANTVAVYGTSGALLESSALTNGQLLIGSTGNAPVAANLTSTGGSVTITNTAGGINLEAAGSSGGTTWSVVTATTASIAANQGIFCNNATGVTVTLPATAAVGDTYKVVAMGGSGVIFSVAVNTGQSIRIGNQFTTTSTGQLRSTSIGDSLTVVCSVLNTAFIITEVIGNITVT